MDGLALYPLSHKGNSVSWEQVQIRRQCYRSGWYMYVYDALGLVQVTQ